MVAGSVGVWNKVLDASTGKGQGADLAFFGPDWNVKPVSYLAIHLNDDR